MKRPAKKRKHHTSSKRKFILLFCALMLIFAGVRHLFHLPSPVTEQKELIEETEEETTAVNTASGEVRNIPLDRDMRPRKGIHPQQMCSGERKYHRVKGVHSWDDCFPDINDVQLVAAQHNGITPVGNREQLQQLIDEHKLVNICHSPYYTVDKLSHSMPYLVPKAQHLLNTICLNFVDSLQAKGLPLHMPIVTSVLRTADDVSRLQRGNGNATTNSCHCYGTTVDITYNRFTPLVGYYDQRIPKLCWDMPMKQVLAEVLRDLRQKGLCYVKYERKQACFHLTVR